MYIFCKQKITFYAVIPKDEVKKYEVKQSYL